MKSDTPALEQWETDLAARGYRKFAGIGSSRYATAMYQRNVTRTGGDGLFFNFDRHDDSEYGTGLTGWMQIRRADERTIEVKQFTFRPSDIMRYLDAIESEWFAIVNLSAVVDDQKFLMIAEPTV
jgi:hypothetical protein